MYFVSAYSKYIMRQKNLENMSLNFLPKVYYVLELLPPVGHVLEYGN